ncbi:MAG: mechanosensitive ion channel [Deltaproteobacteria bacterium]|nr:mechanosensitive ion channel [Deltaproteobacteria bacterium]
MGAETIQWLVLAGLLAGALIAGHVLGWIARRVLRQIVRRTEFKWDDELLLQLRGPIHFSCALAALAIAMPLLDLPAQAQPVLERGARLGLFVALFWGLLRGLSVLGHSATRSVWAKTHPASHALVPLGVRVSKAMVLVIGVIAVLSALGYPVASLVAGLGIGGLVLALAGQKTVENLFGAFSIGIDQPFREGDFVRLDDRVGTVEAIGLRSTRVRTLDRTLVAIPNGRLNEMVVESFAARDRIRLACTIGLVYETTAGQMRTVLEGLERVLREHPQIWPDAVVVRFKEFAACSLDIEVMAWFQTQDWGAFQLMRQNVLLAFMEVVEQAGSSFAFPTQTVHVASAPARDQASTRTASA